MAIGGYYGIVDPDIQKLGDFLNLLLLRIRKGYIYIYAVDLSRKPPDQWPKIDKKVIYFYQANMSKHARYYRTNKKNQKVFFYQRYHNTGIILATEKGDWPQNIKQELFTNINEKPFTFTAGTLEIQVFRTKNNKYDVKLTKDCVHAIKEKFYKNYISRFSLAKYKKHYKTYAQQEIQKILALPSFKSLNNQKRDILQFYHRSFKKLKLKLKIPKKVARIKKFTAYDKIYI